MQAVTQADSPTAEDFASQCAIIEQQRFDELLSLDQLGRERDAGHIFAGFSEAAISFPPTFKVEKGEPGFKYTAKRSPAWCDRILVKSVLPHLHATCESYFTVPAITTSDHKPVSAVLSLPMVTRTVAATRGSPHVHAAASGRASPNVPLSPVNSWGSTAASTLARLSRISRRPSTAVSPVLFRLRLTGVSMGDLSTWDNLALLADHSMTGGRMQADRSAHGGDRSNNGRSQQQQESELSTTSSHPPSSNGTADAAAVVDRGSRTGSAAGRGSKQRLRLELVVSGACLGAAKQEHVSVCVQSGLPCCLLAHNSTHMQVGPCGISSLPADSADRMHSACT